MALKVQSSFSAGELDPALHERTNLEKYRSGLATGRNVIIGKTGRILSRPGRAFFKQTKVADSEVLIYSPPYSGILLEWGHQYVRVYSIDEDITGQAEGTLIADVAHDFTEADLPYIHFETSGNYVYVFRAGSTLKKFLYSGTPAFVTPTSIFGLPATPINFSGTSTGTGYSVQYQVTIVRDGEESLPVTTATGSLPINAGEVNTFEVYTPTVSGLTEIRVYRRPTNAGAFGYVMSSSYSYVSGPSTIFQFKDYGSDADYSHSPPGPVDDFNGSNSDPRYYLSKTGVVYQQRLLLTDNGDNEAIIASRPGYRNNFYREYPLSTDSALKFKSGTSGFAQVLRMIDNDGLVVFTSVGIFLSVGALTPTNLSLDKKGNWIIDDAVPPIAVPGGVLFVDASTNTIRQLLWSTEQASYSGLELNIFSNHLFSGKQIVSWSLQEGDIPLLWVVFNDGTFASFTHERDHEMRAWTRHDSHTNVELVAGTGLPGKTYFVTEHNGTRYIERSIPRYVSVETALADLESDKNESCAAMDSLMTFKTLLNDSLVGADQFVITENAPADPDDPDNPEPWEGPLTINCGTSGLFTAGGNGAIGTILRFFNPDDGTSVDLEVTSRTSDNEVIVQPSDTFPEDYATGCNLYLTVATFTGLDHLETEYPTVVVDGYVVCSPNNDVEDYPSVRVDSGTLTLPNDMRGAIVHIGRAITYDIETLDIDTVEQRPVHFESKTVNKLYVKMKNSRGVYVGNEFPEDDKVTGMQDIETIDVDYENSDDIEILGNRPIAAQTKRYELTLPGDWKSNGRVCFRGVDPLHFEILSITPDLEDLRRG